MNVQRVQPEHDNVSFIDGHLSNIVRGSIKSTKDERPPQVEPPSTYEQYYPSPSDAELEELLKAKAPYEPLQYTFELAT